MQWSWGKWRKTWHGYGKKKWKLWGCRSTYMNHKTEIKPTEQLTSGWLRLRYIVSFVVILVEMKDYIWVLHVFSRINSFLCYINHYLNWYFGTSLAQSKANKHVFVLEQLKQWNKNLKTQSIFLKKGTVLVNLRFTAN